MMIQVYLVSNGIEITVPVGTVAHNYFKETKQRNLKLQNPLVFEHRCARMMGIAVCQ